MAFYTKASSAFCRAFCSRKFFAPEHGEHVRLRLADAIVIYSGIMNPAPALIWASKVELEGADILHLRLSYGLCPRPCHGGVPIVRCRAHIGEAVPDQYEIRTCGKSSSLVPLTQKMLLNILTFAARKDIIFINLLIS